MRNVKKLFFIVLLLSGGISYSQTRDSVIVADIVKEATENSQLEKLAHELLDGIGPRLVGTPQMKQANDWAVAKYKNWGITARNEKWGEWRGWERGASHIDMVYPRVKTLKECNWPGVPVQEAKPLPLKRSFLPMLPIQLLFSNGFLR